MPSSLSGYLPLVGKDKPAISRLNLRELTLKPAVYRSRLPEILIIKKLSQSFKEVR